VHEVRPGIWFVEGENRGRYPYAHSLYLDGGAGNLLVDTGAGQALENLTGRVDEVVLTHYHRDHVKANHLFKGASFSVHTADAPGVESREGFYRLSGLDQIDLEAYWKMVGQIDFTAVEVDRYLGDGDSFDLGKVRLKVLHLPGHTPGHSGFLIEQYGLIYSSDIDLTSFGPWYGNPSSDLDAFRQSIKRVRDLEPELLITSHSSPVTEQINEKLTAYGAVLDQRDEAILGFLKQQPAGIEEIVSQQIIYRNHNGQEALRYFEKSMIMKHLESLQKRALLTETAEGLFEAL
jgi:glyoxylase-like metal-dependent hydrolase (beta-lactamase superfamily II)